MYRVGQKIAYKLRPDIYEIIKIIDDYIRIQWYYITGNVAFDNLSSYDEDYVKHTFELIFEPKLRRKYVQN